MLLLLLVFGINAGVSFFAKEKINQSIKNTPNLQLNYNNFYYQIFTNSFSVENLKFSKKGKFNLQANYLLIKNINWYTLYFKNHIDVSSILLDNVKLEDSNLSANSNSTVDSLNEKKTIPTISIGNLKISNATINAKQGNFCAHKINLNVDAVTYVPNSIATKSPMMYKNISASLSNFNYCYNLYDCLTISQVEMHNATVLAKEISLKTKYSKNELSKVLTEERDHLNLSFPKLKIEGFKIKKIEEKIALSSKLVTIPNPKLEFYRDKNVTDSKKYKAIYGEVFHKLSHSLLVSFPKVHVSNAQVAYSVLVGSDTKVGRVYFNTINAKLGIDNTESSGYLNFESSANLMGKSPITLNFNFKDLKSNQFKASGSILQFKTSYINTFLSHVLNTQLEGVLDETYFTIGGNNKVAHGQIKMKYDNLKLKLMKKELLQVNKLISSLGNLLIDNGSDTDKEGYRNGNIKVERQLNKSFFGYLWLSLKDGILDTLTGKPTI